MKKVLILLLLICLTGCKTSNTYEKYYYTYFDTVSVVKSYSSDDEKTFNDKCNQIEKLLLKYHNYFDTFNDHDVNGLYKLNKNAGKKAIKIDEELFIFLKFGKETYYKTNGKTNIMMGCLTSIWKDSINNKTLPSDKELEDASMHMDIESLVLDEDNMAAYISDEKARIDVGSISKGYVCNLIKEMELELDGYSISLGGNVLLIGKKNDGSLYKVGIKDPFKENSILEKFELSDTSLVTSGNYERYFEKDGVKYHHIIDPGSLYPSMYYASVTVIYPDSALCDGLSTALFSLSVKDGEEILKQYPNIKVVWVYLDGTIKHYN